MQISVLKSINKNTRGINLVYFSVILILSNDWTFYIFNKRIIKCFNKVVRWFFRIVYDAAIANIIYVLNRTWHLKIHYSRDQIFFYNMYMFSSHLYYWYNVCMYMELINAFRQEFTTWCRLFPRLQHTKLPLCIFDALLIL